MSSDLKFVTPSGQQVGVTDVPEHMKIELSNPRALEQRKQLAQNERESKCVFFHEFFFVSFVVAI